VAWLIGAVACVTPGSAADPEALLEQIGTPALDRSRAVSVERLEVDLGAATLTLIEGTLAPAEPITDRVLELAFVGSGRFVFAPDDPIERRQLELFTGTGVIDTTVEQAVLVVGDSAVAERLLEHGTATSSEEAIASVEAFFDGWGSGTLRRTSGARTAAFKAALDDAAYAGYVFAWIDSPESGAFHYRFDPGSYEQVSVGRLAPFHELAEELLDSIEDIKRGGRFKSLRFGGGAWETWSSMPWSDASGDPSPGLDGFEPKHYETDIFVDVNDDIARGRSRIRIVPTEAGRRVATLDLHGSLEVQSVRDPDGQELYWYREGGQFHVVLPEPVPPGTELTLNVEYEGSVIRKVEGGVFVLRSPHQWYPRIGTVDRATCDTTLRWRDKFGFQGLASGRKVDEGVEKGIAWRRYVLDVPSFGCSLEVGKFDVHELRVGHVDVTVAFSTTSGRMDSGVKKEVLATIGDVLTFFEDKLGAYPVDHLTVVTLPRRFSQGSLGFVTISDSLLRVPRGYVSLLSPAERERRRKDTIAHEISHQWWGNKVGWASYRDQWLSEALASYSATVYGASRAASRAVYLAAAAQEWRTELGEDALARNGQPLESIGPVVLGGRLRSRIADAYEPIVYTKGSVVFSMLARTIGEEPFLAMLKALADRVDHRVIDTAVFLGAIERMSGLGLDSFAEQFVYGTGIPDIFYDYAILPREDGGWLIEGTARRVPRSRFSVTLRRGENGSWDVVRSRRVDEGVRAGPLVVPFQIALKPDKGGKKNKGVSLGLGGTMTMQGREFVFRIPSNREPTQLWLDQRGEVLAFFRDAKSWPKTALVFLAGTREEQEAIETLEAALGAPLYSDAMRQARKVSDRELRKQTEAEDGDIYLELADLHLNAGHIEQARAAFDAAAERLTWVETSPRGTVVKARLLMLQGKHEQAYKTIEWARDPPWHWTLGRADFGHRRAEALAILALAAFETGRSEETGRALRRAERAGADMSALRAAMDSKG
jgi:hypothetical protein